MLLLPRSASQQQQQSSITTYELVVAASADQVLTYVCMYVPTSTYTFVSWWWYHDCILFEAREERQLESLRRQRITLRLADALIVTASRLVIRVENMVTTSSLEVLGVDLNVATCMSTGNYLRLALLVLLSSLLMSIL